MIVLDTNVVSEPLKINPHPGVMDWLNRQAVENLYLTAPGLAELLVGIEYLPDGRRKKLIAEQVTDTIIQRFESRVLNFDQAGARAYATLMARARATGRPVAVIDGQIAAIALTHGFAVATRDAAPYETASVSVINPWTAT